MGNETTKRKKTIFNISGFDTRSVTEIDLKWWCTRDVKEQRNPEAPYGYVVRIPDFFDGMILKGHCTIKSFRSAGNKLVLQVDPEDCIFDKQYKVHYKDGKTSVDRTSH